MTANVHRFADSTKVQQVKTGEQKQLFFFLHLFLFHVLSLRVEVIVQLRLTDRDTGECISQHRNKT